jgi:2-amino-4-hydroxy-6-hydroxymethyldihydropteridine diphosphokinase
MIKTIYLGLGSNLGDRALNLRRAVEKLESSDLRITRLSPLYETEPMDYRQQPWFLNQVAEGETGLFPVQLLSRVGRVERALGRVRGIPKGPRVIDIDILFFGQAVVRTPRLEIPHPAIAERRFVLVPLADLAPSLRHPVSHLTVREMLEKSPASKVTPYRERELNS